MRGEKGNRRQSGFKEGPLVQVGPRGCPGREDPLPRSTKPRSRALLCPFAAAAREGGVGKATRWLRRGRLLRGMGTRRGSSCLTPCSFTPLAIPALVLAPHHPEKPNRARGWVWKRPGFIRQADVQADSSIPMHTITGFYTGLCPSCPLLRRSRVRSSPRRQRGAWAFLAKGTGLPAPHFHSQIPRALLRKLGESKVGDRNPDSRLHLRERGVSVPACPRASTDPSQRVPEGARISPVSGHRCHRFGKRTLTDGSGEGKGFWLPQRSPIQDMGTRALHRACGC